jgi:hypothetical protein
LTICDDAALAALRSGLCVVPPREDGSKRPDGKWEQYQTTPPTEQQITTWYSSDRAGIGVICGAVSGHLEMVEFEGRAVEAGVKDRFIDRCEATGLADVLNRVVAGYAERTPGGGIHLLYRCPDGVEGNLKLARRPATAGELDVDPTDKVKVLIETRGEGGYVIVAPSNGTVHPTGRAWELLYGGVDTIATITGDERAALLDVARSFDEMPQPEYRAPVTTAAANGDRPGDWYNANHTWPQILEPAGWVLVARHGDEDFWRRPGKLGDDHSATTNYRGGDGLYVFSTSTVFESERNYDRFGAYAVLEHGGDLSAAAKAIAAQMPGDRLTGGDLPAVIEPGGQPDDVEDVVGWRNLFIDGRTWITSGADQPTALWGTDATVLWAKGQPLVIAGPQGAGKTALGQRLLLARIGVGPATVAGLAVPPDGRRALYLASDRPDQARLSMTRMIGEGDLDRLAERLTVWQGPPPTDVAQNPALLHLMADAADADLVVIDSLKDIALKLSDDAVGAAVNRAVQHCIAAGIEVVALHHPRKLGGGDGDRPRVLDDLYGSYWLTAGAGSVLYLHPGPGVVDLYQMKTPTGIPAELRLEHDLATGSFHIATTPSVFHFITEAGRDGITIRHLACCLHGVDVPTESQLRTTRRTVNGQAEEGSIEQVPGQTPTRWRTAE